MGNKNHNLGDEGGGDDRWMVVVKSSDDWTNKRKEDCLSVLENKRINCDRNDLIEKKFVIMTLVLLKGASNVASLRDGSGLTPLHLAASINKNLNLALIQCMIEYNPHCMEVCDTSGKTIFHHLVKRIVNRYDAKGFFTKTRIHSLVNHQDNDGNTPSLLVLKDSDLTIAEIIADDIIDANLYLKNKEGLSVYSSANHQSEVFKILAGKASVMMTEDTSRIIERGDVFAIKKHMELIGRRFYKSHDLERRNVIHKLLLLIKPGCVIIPKIFKDCMKSNDYAQLMKQTDKKDNTPCHVLAQLNPTEIMIHLATGPRDNPAHPENLYPGPQPSDPEFFTTPYLNYSFVWENLGNSNFFKELVELCLNQFQEEWLLMKNKKGNTPLHEAILANNYFVFKHLAPYNRKALTSVNKQNETVLHLLATKGPTTPTIDDDALVDLIENYSNVNDHFVDNNGLTPIMRAIQAGNHSFANRLWKVMSTKFKELKGHNGQTFWHLLAKQRKTSFEPKNDFFTKKDVCDQLRIRDDEGNTALHLALTCCNYDTALFFLECYKEENLIRSLLDIENKKGKTAREMIGSSTYLPPRFLKFIRTEPEMFGTRSIYAIPTTKMKGYVNTMGVTAALLTTITFTAAFTVPGGHDQENGTPLLIQEPAFQVFIISDVLAMCYSMMVLFCLLWVMGTGNKRYSVLLLDFSMSMLKISFYFTILTFMTGLYATLHHVKRWIAIVPLIPCAALVVILQRSIILNYSIWSSTAAGFFKTYFPSYVKDLLNWIPLIKSFIRGMVEPRPPKRKPELPMSTD